MTDFKPGLYRHYKGGLYTALCLVTHHEGRHPMVLYVSHHYGGTNVRPLHGVKGDRDGFLDNVSVSSKGMIITGNPDIGVPRFEFVRELPNDDPIDHRG